MQSLNKRGVGGLSKIAPVIGFLFFSASAFADAGAELYNQRCAACHGAAGAGDGPQAGKDGVAAPRALTETAKTRMTVEKAMMQGIEGVPGHGNAALLTADELRALIDYTHQLANPK